MPAVGYEFLLPEYADVAGGWQDALSASNPAVGAGFSRRVPGETFEILLALGMALTTSAAVATRIPQLVFYNSDGDGVFAVESALSQPASSVFGHRWTVSVAAAYTTGGVSANNPGAPLVALQGWFIRVIISSGQAGDQISSITLVLQRFPTGPLEGKLKAGGIEAEVLSLAGFSGSATPFIPPASTPGVSAAPPPTFAPQPQTVTVTQPQPDLTPGTFTIKAI